MLTVLLFALSFSAASLALGSLIGSAIHYAGAWDALEAEAQAGFTRTVTITVREPRLGAGQIGSGEVVWMPALRPLAGRPTDGLRAAA